MLDGLKKEADQHQKRAEQQYRKNFALLFQQVLRYEVQQSGGNERAGHIIDHFCAYLLRQQCSFFINMMRIHQTVFFNRIMNHDRWEYHQNWCNLRNQYRKQRIAHDIGQRTDKHSKQK